MAFALAAGKLFDVDHPGEFEETILGMDTFLFALSLLSTNSSLLAQQNA